MPQYFHTGSRKAQILHTRLRTNCSSLNLDLFMKNITDSPLCSCGSVENAQHFLFHCHKYQAQRNELLNSISLYYTPSLHLLLQGELTLAEETNKIIFEKVQNFIIETKRFWRTILCIRPWKLFANATVTNFWSTNLVNDVSLCPLSLFFSIYCL